MARRLPPRKIQSNHTTTSNSRLICGTQHSFNVAFLNGETLSLFCQTLPQLSVPITNTLVGPWYTKLCLWVGGKNTEQPAILTMISVDLPSIPTQCLAQCRTCICFVGWLPPIGEKWQACYMHRRFVVVIIVVVTYNNHHLHSCWTNPQGSTGIAVTLYYCQCRMNWMVNSDNVTSVHSVTHFRTRHDSRANHEGKGPLALAMEWALHRIAICNRGRHQTSNGWRLLLRSSTISTKTLSRTTEY